MTKIIDLESIQYDQITLQKIKKGMSVVLGYTSLESVNISTYEDMVVGKIVSASFDVLADKIHEDRVSVWFNWKTPETWWQHFKKDVMPEWFISHYPIRYTPHRAKRTAIFRRYAEYPKANIAIPKDQKIFIETLGGLEVIHDEVGQL